MFHFRLERFETYQIEHITDLTGTFIESSVPIAAFSGNAANVLDNIGSFDHIVTAHSQRRQHIYSTSSFG